MSSPGGRCVVISCLITVAFISVFFTFRYIQKSSDKVEEWEKSHRLPEDIVPVSYSLTLYPDLVGKSFHGENNIKINISQERNSIILHSKELNISKAELFDKGNKLIPVKEMFEYEDNEFWILIPHEKLQIGEYELNLTFSGNLTTKKNIGFYRSKYTAPDGSKRQIATSKFEPTYARQAFPCFDEPGFKATFNIKLVKPTGSNYIALSNMNQKNEVPDQPRAGLTTVEFEKSVPMSTYLACFIVCDFDHLPSIKSKQGFPVTVYARPGQASNMNYSLDLAVKTIDYYIEYFNISYPLPKLDLIAIPDFVSGAMEHWGLVTFRETAVLFNEATNSLVNKKQVSLTVAHELAHMWFGNLVTMEWWNDLWLNEGFANYIEYKGVNHTHPDWDLDTQLLLDNTHRVLSLDSALSSHPIVQTVSHPDQITEIFDTISYNKGTTIIRMLENMIGPEAFQLGVSNYLKKFAYKNAVTEDLWNELEKESNGIKISKIMSTWTNQMGYPLVNVNRSGDVLTLTQQRFLASINTTFDETDSPFRYKWNIPITYVCSTNSSEVHRAWLYYDQPSVNITLPAGTDWVKINFRQFGYYRVRYFQNEWKQLTNMLQKNHERISAADRANLITDAFSLAKAGYRNYTTAFNSIEYIPKETHFVPLLVTSHKLQYLQSILSGTPAFAKFRKYVHKLLNPIMSDSLWDGSSAKSYLERRRKIVTLEFGCLLWVPSCVNKAREIFQNWIFKNGSKPEPELRSLVYEIGIAEGGETEWDKLWQLYLVEQEPQEKAKLRRALTAVREPWLINRYIDLAKDENNVRSQDFLSVLISISENPVGAYIIWDFVRDQWGYLVKRFTLNNRTLGILLPRITDSFSTQTKLNELKSFLNANPEAGAGAAGRRLAVEKIENNIRWISANLPELLSLFK